MVSERVSTQRTTDVPESRVAQATQEFSVTQTVLSARVYRPEIAAQDGRGGRESASVRCKCSMQANGIMEEAIKGQFSSH